MRRAFPILLGAALACGDSVRTPGAETEASATDTDPTVADTTSTGWVDDHSACEVEVRRLLSSSTLHSPGATRGFALL